ncbi:MAG: molecular chaperone HtpG [Alphaproteobacteria bacterium]|nr:molecular chaperone HtpG [Alphaproteobacteria bacterium]
MTEQTHAFQAEVSRLLHIVVHSLYSEKEIFLRELISNASDACDRLRYLALTRPELLDGGGELLVTLEADSDHGTLVIADNGIGMNREELAENLGTIARSGTAAFLQQLSGDAVRDMSLIGQFGVGFYSAFMVASRVDVYSRKAGETQGWHWSSEGSGTFSIGEAADVARGTRILLRLREDAREFLERASLERIVRRYSDHIALPILLREGGKEERLNRAAALWTRPRAEISPEQYTDFYRHVSHGFDEPWATIHQRAEGKIEYAALLFIPSQPPFDLFNPDRKHAVKLYVRRVFITDDCQDLIPPYLRFLRGIVDSEDLPLNVSREMLQENPVLARIRHALVKRVFSELETRAKEDQAGYLAFWRQFGAVLKEGIYEDFENRERILKLARFQSSGSDGLISLEEYLARMKPGQEAIYFIAADRIDAALRSPQIEGFRAKGVEVLLLADPVDDFWVGTGLSYEGKPFRSVTRAGADLDRIAADPEQAQTQPAEAPDESESATLIALFRQSLGDQVKDVRLSRRLTDSPVCLVAAEGDMDMHLARVLRRARQIEGETPRILEINGTHPLIRQLAAMARAGGQAERIGEAAHLLLDQARILEGEAPADPGAFARRLADAVARALVA